MENIRFPVPLGEYYIVDFTATGEFRQSAVKELLKTQLKDKSYTDVVIVSHGWNTGRTDRGSIELPDEVIEQMQKRKPTNVKPLYVAVKWPSTTRTLFQGQVLDTAGGFRDVIKQIRKLIKSDESVLADPSKLFSMARSVPVQMSVMDVVDAIEKEGEKFINDDKDDDTLPDELSNNIAKLVNEFEETPVQKSQSMTTKTVQDRYKEIRSKNTMPETTTATRALPLIGAVRTAKRVYDLTYTLFNIFFGTFERRASIVGTNGLHELLRFLMTNAEKSVRFHMYGHSLGAHVVLSGAIGSGSTLPRKIHTVLLAQGCIPKDVLADDGLYRSIVDGGKPIAGSILATIFRWDRALMGYDVWMPPPLGRFGFVDTKPMKLKTVVIESSGDDETKVQKESFEAGKCYNLDGKAIIEGHSDVTDRELMDLFWQAASIDIKQ